MPENAKLERKTSRWTSLWRFSTVPGFSKPILSRQSERAWKVRRTDAGTREDISIEERGVKNERDVEECDFSRESMLSQSPPTTLFDCLA